METKTKAEMSEFLQSLVDFMIKESKIKIGNIDKEIGRAEIVKDIIIYIRSELTKD